MATSRMPPSGRSMMAADTATPHPIQAAQELRPSSEAMNAATAQSSATAVKKMLSVSASGAAV